MFSPDATRLLATGVLAGACLAAGVWVWMKIRATPFSLVQGLLYGLNYAVARVLWRARVHGRLGLAHGQGAVIVCNHRSSLDPSFIHLATARVVHWMVAKEYCDSRALGWILRICEVIPTSRAGLDTAATKMAIRCTEQGGLTGVFLEGHINTTDQLLRPVRSGAAMIALKARAAVVPCYLRGSPYDGTPLGCLLMPAKVDLYLGEAIDLSPYFGREREREVLEDLTRRFVREIAKLAGQGDFEPKLAGRQE
jgi:1-acyl-sn-glycerol-3-phosphate acyltransferase